MRGHHHYLLFHEVSSPLQYCVCLLTLHSDHVTNLLYVLMLLVSQKLFHVQATDEIHVDHFRRQLLFLLSIILDLCELLMVYSPITAFYYFQKEKRSNFFCQLTKVQENSKGICRLSPSLL